MDKLVLVSPIDGIVLSRLVEPGEVVPPGIPLITLGSLDDLTITVYIPENQYGAINLGQKALVKVDSFPGETFDATVVRIADQAEFTPRNVQTQEERQTTVYAVKLSVNDTEGKLKPGMPADVVFVE
jgi:multidrug resistance efflux pump